VLVVLTYSALRGRDLFSLDAGIGIAAVLLAKAADRLRARRDRQRDVRS
jgi:hypothetical protein